MAQLSSRRSLLVGAVAAGALATSAAPASARPHRDLLPGGAFDQLVTQQAAQDKFSGTVLLAHQNRPVLTRSYGMANQQQSTPNRPDTVFNLASVTKCFTGLAIAQLAARGAVAFREKLATYLDGFPADVTVHQLLTHTSGIGRPALGSGPPPEWNSVEETVEGTMAIIKATPPRFPPGTRFGYSNDAFWVLGAIVAKVTGQSYFDYVREHIFTPAGMTSADFYTRPQVLAARNIAHPYWTEQSGGRSDFSASPYFWFIGGPDGGAYASAEDLLRFATALRTGRLLSPSFAELATSGKVPVPPSEKPTTASQWFTGYGFEHYIFGDQRAFGHPGNGPGTATNIDIYPDLDWTAVILGNYDTTIDPIINLERQLISQQH